MRSSALIISELVYIFAAVLCQYNRVGSSSGIVGYAEKVTRVFDKNMHLICQQAGHNHKRIHLRTDPSRGKGAQYNC